MGPVPVLRLLTKRTNIVKFGLYVISFYSLYVLLQVAVRFKDYPEQFSNPYVKMVETRKTGLQLKWMSNQASNTKKEENSIHDVSKYKLEIIQQNKLPRRIKIGVFFDENMAKGKLPNILEENKARRSEEAREEGKAKIDRLFNVLPGLSQQLSAKKNVELGKERIAAKRRYIFTLRYYEQLAGAAKNLIDLASLAKHFDREVVMPFVNNSRMNGIQERGQQHLTKPIFGNLSRYFDIDHFNSTLRERGYAPLAHFKDFMKDCYHGLDVLVHFIYNDSFSFNDARNWFGLDTQSWKDLRHKMPRNGGVQTCNFLKKSGIQRLLGGFAVRKYICVDPEIIRTADQIENTVFKGQGCIGILQWKGSGRKRTHFPLPRGVFQTLNPSDIQHNRALVGIAKDFVKNHVRGPFIAVHIRAERQLSWYGLDRVLKCVNSLSRKAFRRINKFQINNVFLATDLPAYGSDTYKNNLSGERVLVHKHLRDTLKKPRVFSPELYGIHDKGEISLIEMNILSLGESLYTVGGGKFQQWVVELFLAHNTEDRSLVHRFCLEKFK